MKFKKGSHYFSKYINSDKYDKNILNIEKRKKTA
jgi:hypothetical protein